MPSDKTTQIILSLGKDSFPATFLTGTEKISEPFAFRAEFLAPYSFKVKQYPGTQVILEFKAADGHHRRLSGLINFIEETGTRLQNVKQKVIHIDVVPRMQMLAHHSDHRILLGRTAADIVKETLERHGYKPEHLKFHLSQSLPVHPYTLQVEQTDLEFVQRVLARDGIFYYFDCESKDNVTFEVIHFQDATSFSPYLKRGLIRYLPSTGMAQTENNKVFTSIFKIHELHSLVKARWAFHDYNDQTPEANLLTTRESSTKNKFKGKSTETLFGQGTLSLDSVEQQSRFAAERAIIEAHKVSASGDIADMSAGRLVSLDAKKFEIGLTGDYLIVQVEHHLDHRAAHDLTTPLIKAESSITSTKSSPDYHCDTTLVKRELNYRPELPPRPIIPLTFTARIESEGRYASLDSQGRYHLRKLLDLGDRPHTQAIEPPLRKLQPFGGPMQVFTSGTDSEAKTPLPTGIHFPLQDGDEVLLSCLNGDPDRPMIVGSHFDANRTNPVNHNNKNQNRWKTKSDNELLMDDKIDTQVIQMRTYEGFNILQFDAKTAEHKIRLATEHGAIHRYAKKTYFHKSDDTHEEIIGNKRLQLVENKSITKTNKGEIHYQTPTDIWQKGGTNIKHNAGQNIEMTAKQNQIIVVEDEDMDITVEGGGGLRIHIKNDELHIQVAKEIRIEGQGGGDITFHQSGGGFCVTKSGDIKMFGQDIQLKADNGVSLTGNVSYTVSSPPPGPKPKPQPKLEPAEINILKDPRAPDIINLKWSEKYYRIESEVTQSFTAVNVKPGELATIKVYERDQGESLTELESIPYTLEKGPGHYDVTWTRSAGDAQSDLDEESEENAVALTYVFKVETNQCKSEISPDLLLPTTYEIRITNAPGGQGLPYIEESYTLSKSGKIIREDVTDQDGLILVRCIDPTTDYYLEILGYKYRLDSFDIKPKIENQGLRERMNLMGFSNDYPEDSKEESDLNLSTTMFTSYLDLDGTSSNSTADLADIELNNGRYKKD